MRRRRAARGARGDEIRFLEEAEWEAVLAARHSAGDYEALDRALYLTAPMAGLRHGELCALRWRDVDWPAGRIRVRQNWVLGEYGTPKFAGEAQRADGGPARRRARPAVQGRGGQADDDAGVRRPATGEPLDKAGEPRRFRKALKAAGSTRRTASTSCATRSARAWRRPASPMRTLQEWMGHRDIATTQRYADYAPSPTSPS